MALFNLADAADRLPHAWKSAILARSGDCNIKILKWTGSPIRTKRMTTTRR